MKRTVRSLLFTGLLSLLLIPAAIPAAAGGGGPAPSKSTTTVSIRSASLAPGGVAVAITYSCLPSGPYGGFGDVRVAEAGAASDSFFNPICNDTKITQTIEVFGPFTAGTAAVGVFACGFDCAQTSKEVNVR